MIKGFKILFHFHLTTSRIIRVGQSFRRLRTPAFERPRPSTFPLHPIIYIAIMSTRPPDISPTQPTQGPGAQQAIAQKSEGIARNVPPEVHADARQRELYECNAAEAQQLRELRKCETAEDRDATLTSPRLHKSEEAAADGDEALMSLSLPLRGEAATIPAGNTHVAPPSTERDALQRELLKTRYAVAAHVATIKSLQKQLKRSELAQMKLVTKKMRTAFLQSLADDKVADEKRRMQAQFACAQRDSNSRRFQVQVKDELLTSQAAELSRVANEKQRLEAQLVDMQHDLEAAKVELQEEKQRWEELFTDKEESLDWYHVELRECQQALAAKSTPLNIAKRQVDTLADERDQFQNGRDEFAEKSSLRAQEVRSLKAIVQSRDSEIVRLMSKVKGHEPEFEDLETEIP